MIQIQVWEDESELWVVLHHRGSWQVPMHSEIFPPQLLVTENDYVDLVHPGKVFRDRMLTSSIP